jgi:serine/threonine-protein kinase RsbW
LTCSKAPGAVEEFNFILEVRHAAQERALLFERLRRLALQRQWIPAVADEVELILEEWLTNILSYGLVGNTGGEIQVSLKEQGEVVQITVCDNGLPFNPTQQGEPDVTRAAEEREIGGLGIFMMRKLSSKISYERTGDWNKLVVEKNLRKPVLTKN